MEQEFVQEVLDVEFGIHVANKHEDLQRTMQFPAQMNTLHGSLGKV